MGHKRSFRLVPEMPVFTWRLMRVTPSTIALGADSSPRFAPFTGYLLYAIGVAGDSLTLAVKEISGLN